MYIYIRIHMYIYIYIIFHLDTRYLSWMLLYNINIGICKISTVPEKLVSGSVV